MQKLCYLKKINFKSNFLTDHWRIEGGQEGLAPPPLKLVKV